METILFQNVSKKLGNNQVLSDVSLSVQAGEVIGIVGANGSGKTTMLRLAAGLMYPDKGEVWISEKKVYPGLVGNLPVGVGALIEAPVFLPQYSGKRNLTMLAGIQGKITKNEVEETMKYVGLDPHSKKAVRAYSLGMRQRLGIAQAIMEKPKVLLLDEPTNGLDQDGVQLFAHILEEQKKSGVATLIVSHIQEEINRLCDKVFALQDGQLKSVQRERRWTVLVKTLEEIELLHQTVPSFQLAGRVNDVPAGTCSGTWQSREELFSFLEKHGVHPVEIRETRE